MELVTFVAVAVAVLIVAGACYLAYTKVIKKHIEKNTLGKFKKDAKDFYDNVEDKFKDK